MVPIITGAGGTTHANVGSTTDTPFAGVVITDLSPPNPNPPFETLNLTLSDANAHLAYNGHALTDGTGGVYQLSGSASAVTSKLDALTLTAPATLTGAVNGVEALTISLSDTSSLYPGAPTTASVTVDIVAPPTITGAGAGAGAGETFAGQGSTTDKPFAGVTVGDANAGATDTLTITLSDANASLAFNGLTLTAVSQGVYQLTGSASAITSELDALTLNAPATLTGAVNGAEALTFSLSDTSSGSPAAPTTATATAYILSPKFSVAFADSGKIETFIVPPTGYYAITADGAQGGSGVNNFGGVPVGAGGLGAMASGDVFLQAGATLEIVVGRAGGNGSLGTSGGSPGGSGGGGGGGSFVIETNSGSGTVDINEVIAGGGGGGALASFGGGGSYINATLGVAELAATNSGDGSVTISALCYCLGTRIRTVRGEIAVEDLAIGDLAVTATGDARPVQWIGRRRIDLTRHADPDRVRPIRIAACAFPGGVPQRDLLVSPDHAVVFERMLIPARLLANGASIAADTACREVTYFHVELASHDILLAEGLAAESYLDTGNRDMFENAGFEYDAPTMALHPDFGTGQQARVSGSCLPFADRPDQIEPVWRALADRARALGWAVPRPMLIDDPDLHVRIGTHRIDPVAVRDGRYTFVLPAGGAPVALASRAGRPSAARPWIADDRLLGAMVRRLAHRGGDGMREVAMDDPALRQGWWAVESDAGWPCRWTSGDAILPVLGAGVLEVELSGVMMYPAALTAAVVATQPERATA